MTAQPLTIALAALAVVVAYLVGSIPFGLLIARWAKGIDVRTVGSGNIGATNVGRVLGLRFFFLVFALDMLKGLVPTLALPLAVARLSGERVVALPVLVALATILGHNFPVYLRFQGGKGVATSFGALLALEPIALVAAGLAFPIFLLITRYVSMSSLLAGLVFTAAHFLATPDPWHGGALAMSLLTFALMGLLIVRHRKNLVRIHQGTEPKVRLGRKRPAGKAGVRLVAVLAVLGAGLGLLLVRIASPARLDCGAFVLRTAARVGTGHQRAERLAFADGGRLLAVTCPRYDRIVLYRVGPSGLTIAHDLAFEGRPVALGPTADRLYVLERPIADARHVEAGWLEAVALDGRPVGSKLRVGFDPDDFAVSPDGRWAYVLTSGRAEGESNRPEPALVVVDLAPEQGEPAVVGRLSFDGPKDDPDRISLSSQGRRAAVSLLGSNEVALIDLADPRTPRLLSRSPMRPGGTPDRLAAGDDALWAPVGPPCDATRLRLGAAGEFLLGVDPEVSVLNVTEVDASAGRPVGRLTLRGAANLGGVRPMGLAVSPDGSRLAVADRSGGVHLIAVLSKNAGPGRAQGEAGRAEAVAGAEGRSASSRR